MVFRHNNSQGVRRGKKRVTAVISVLALVLGSGGLTLAMANSASADTATTISGCSFVESATLWTLQSNCNSSQEIDIPAGVTLDGKNFTISPTFAKTSNSNNAVLGILSSNNVTIHDLTIDGSAGANLHGINSYVSAGVKIDHVTVKNMAHIGIEVNASDVTVGNVTTANNGWNGIDVDLGGGLPTTAAAVLNIVGTMNQSDALQILVDDTRKAVSVNDVKHQYAVMHFTKDGAPAAAYVLSKTGKESCKNGGWLLGLNLTQSFKNQGQCVAFFEKGDKKSDSQDGGDKSKTENEKD